MKKFQLQKSDHALAESILKKMNGYQKKHTYVAKLDFGVLYKLLSPNEKELARKMMKLNPKDYGFKGPHYGIVPVPKNLIVVRGQKYCKKGEKITLPAQLVPQNTHSAFFKLNRAMKKDISKTLLIESGYRSPAYQFIIFLYYFKLYKWNLYKTVKRVALPGYSEHGYPKRQALDFITTDGIPSDEKPLKFAETKEYKWLLKNANDFSFYLSYPRNNKWGVMFEPWHWVFEKRR